MENQVKSLTDNVRIVPFTGTRIASWKAEFEGRLRQIAPSIAQAIKSGQMVTCDLGMYATRSLEADTTVELMQSSDNKAAGVTNIDNRRLQANQYALYGSISLLAAEAETADEALTADYDVIPAKVAAGEFELKIGDKIYLQRMSCEAFRHRRTDVNKGELILDCPKIIPPLTEIIPTLYLPKSTINGTKKTYVRIIFRGVRTVAA